MRACVCVCFFFLILHSYPVKTSNLLREPLAVCIENIQGQEKSWLLLNHRNGTRHESWYLTTIQKFALNM